MIPAPRTDRPAESESTRAVACALRDQRHRADHPACAHSRRRRANRQPWVAAPPRPTSRTPMPDGLPGRIDRWGGSASRLRCLSSALSLEPRRIAAGKAWRHRHALRPGPWHLPLNSIAETSGLRLFLSVLTLPHDTLRARRHPSRVPDFPDGTGPEGRPCHGAGGRHRRRRHETGGGNPDEVGFEPTIRFHAWRFSRPLP